MTGMIDTLQTAKSSVDRINQAPQRNLAETDGSGDEINILELLYVFIKHKTLIIILCGIGFVGGFIAARFKAPTFIAEAVVTAKESERQSANLGALGAFGSLAGQLNLAGNPGLDKIQLYLNSREFNAQVIDKYDLTNEIYAKAMPKLYRKYYDTTTGVWNEIEGEFRLRRPKELTNVFNKEFFKQSVTKEGTLILEVKSSDSLFSYKVLDRFLEHLDYYIRTDIQTEAKENVSYLEKQLFTIPDPLLREKLQEKIAAEIEKAMVVSKEAFKVLDRPFCYKQRSREKILYPVAGFFVMFFISSVVLIFAHYIFGPGNTDSESRKWVDMIRKELKKII
jgi:uncharacterized protein involved in exopolysaccharide biosynthesis